MNNPEKIFTVSPQRAIETGFGYLILPGEEEELRWLLEELTEIIDDDCKTASRSIKKVRDIVCLAKARQAVVA